MKLKPQELARHLKQKLLPLYWIAGDEPLLRQEAADQLRSACRAQGFGEREIFDVDRSFDWQRFTQSTGNLSLFAERKLIELRLDAGLDEAGRDALQHYLGNPNPDFLILLSSARLESSTLNTKWFKAIETAAGFIQVWPLSLAELPQWLGQRLLQQGIRARPEALQLLVDKVEGNLLAAVQEIEKLKLLAQPTEAQTIELDTATVMQVVADHSRYNGFTLIDAALAGNGKRLLKILQGLRNEAVQPLAIVGALNNEVGNLLHLQARLQQGESTASVLQSSRVLFHRKELVGRALGRLKTDQLWELLDRLRIIDQAVKGLSIADPWDELGAALLGLCGVNSRYLLGNAELES